MCRRSRVSCVCVCVRDSGRGGGAQPFRTPDVGEQLPPQEAASRAPRQRKRSGPMAGMRVTAAARRVRRMGPRAPAGTRIEPEGVRSVYAMKFDTACSTARLGVGAT